MADFPAQWDTVARDAGFTEGCTPFRDGIAFVAINRGTVTLASLDGSAPVTVHEVGGGPNGAAVDRHGQVWIAQNGGQVVPTKSSLPVVPGIQRVNQDGVVDQVASDGLLAPNDLAFGPDGRLWFTDPRGSTEHPQLGAVWALDVTDGRLDLILDNLDHPNGLAFTPDGLSLLVGETRARHVIALQPADDGRWRHTGVFCEYPDGEPDGMAFDHLGRLWVAGSAGHNLAVFAPDGRVEHVMSLGPSFPTNVCFAGRRLDTVVVAAAKGGRILAARAPVPGVALFGGPVS
jgi:gluconolactonase